MGCWWEHDERRSEAGLETIFCKGPAHRSDRHHLKPEFDCSLRALLIENRSQRVWVRRKNDPLPLDGVSDFTRLLGRASPSDALDGMSCLDFLPV